MTPTDKELTRAAELAERIKEICLFLEPSPVGKIMVYDSLSDGVCERPVSPLDPCAFQAVVLALPANTYGWAMVRAATDAKLTYLEFIRYILTPAGMLAFYEALVKAQEEDGKTE